MFQSGRRRPVAAALTAHALTFGTSASLGALLPELTSFFTEPGWLAVLIASLPTSILLFWSRAAGRFADHHGSRRLMLGGGIAVIAGLLLAASVRTPLAFALALVVPLGAGGAAMFTPSLSHVIVHVQGRQRRRGLSMAAAGSSVGVLALPPATAYSVLTWDLQITLLGLAAVVAFGWLLMVRWATPDRRGGLSHQQGSQQLGPLVRIGFSVSLAYYIPLVHLVRWMATQAMSVGQISMLLVLLGGANLAGRLLADVLLEWGIQRTLIASALAVPISLLLQPRTGMSTFIAIAVVYGLASGIFVVAYSAAGAAIAGTREGVTMGRLYGAMAPGALLGPLAVVVLLDSFQGYPVAIAAVGLAVAGGVLFAAIRYVACTNERT